MAVGEEMRSVISDDPDSQPDQSARVGQFVN